MVKFFRVDDRLIHGQIVTAWINHLNTKSIIVADDEASTNSLSLMLFEMAIPKGINLKVLSVSDSIPLINSLEEDVMLICGSLKSAAEIIRNSDLKELNIGNINATKERKKIAMSLWLTEEEKDLVRELLTSGTDVFYQTVPSEKKLRLKNLI